MMQVEFQRVDWPFLTPFRIAYELRVVAETVRVTLTKGSHVGRGEGLCIGYHGESVDSMLTQLEAVKSSLSRGVSRADLADLLPPGGARNAVDCALWDLEAKRTGSRAWELAGVSSVDPIATDCTVGLDTPQTMATAAAALRQFRRLKLKLSGDGDLERVLAVHTARPDAELIVDANQAWTASQLRELAPRLAEVGVKLIEQPLPVGKDEPLVEYTCPVPLCADESCQTRESLPEVVGKYQYVNIKLDKTGGLTEALRLAAEARRRRLRLMVGCMAGSSLSMAPAFIIGQFCDFVDLDGPLLLASDLVPPIRYQGDCICAPERQLWG